jgi:hypothetical protein
VTDAKEARAGTENPLGPPPIDMPDAGTPPEGTYTMQTVQFTRPVEVYGREPIPAGVRMQARRPTDEDLAAIPETMSAVYARAWVVETDAGPTWVRDDAVEPIDGAGGLE